MIDWNRYVRYENGNLYWNDLSSYEELSNHTKCKIKSNKIVGTLSTGRSNFYWRFTLKINDVTFKLKNHRVIWEMFNGEIPNGMQIDHINRITTDNRIENLRLATPSQNMCNKIPKYKNKKSIYKGVWFRGSRNTWVSSFKFMGKNYWVGSFKTEDEAHEAYKSYAKNIIGDFMPDNLTK